MSIYEDIVRPILNAIPHREITEHEMLDINLRVQHALLDTGKVAYSYVTFHPNADRVDGHVTILPKPVTPDEPWIKIYRTMDFTVPYETTDD